MSQRIGIYAGTFDPITNGHIDIVHRALHVVDTVVIAIATGSPKDTLFSAEERQQLGEKALQTLDDSVRKRIEVEYFDGLLVDYVEKKKSNVIIRGLRAVSDYEYEAQMALINRHLNPDIETVFFVTSENCSYISSSIVKNIAANNGDISSLVPKEVEKALKANITRIDT
ncbi:UNVERIFIED_CONTAM: hypothetical protein GTU68_062724 [Idotea baltica]|nr:hypothetical protein [Idotea baltica]